MKKNITINLFGTLYNIDEDAYQLLDNYLMSMKNYFGRQLNGDEIADDIEHRVAELLWDYKEKGIEAVSIDIIKEIIGKIGNPSEIDTNNGNEQPDQQSQSFASEEQGAGSGQRSNSGQSAGEAFQNFAHEAGRSANNAFHKAANHFAGRHLYRDPNDKLLGGVCSGIANYLGICDPIWIRLAFILLALFSRLLMLPIYLILWIVVPLAQTPEDRLRMKGEKVNPDTLNAQVISESEQQEKGTYNPSTASHSGCLRIIFGCILAFLLLPLIALLFFIIFAFVAVLGMSLGLIGNLPGFFGFTSTSLGEFFSNLASCFAGHEWFIWVGLLFAVYAIYVPVYFIVRAIRSGDRPLSSTQIVSYIISWLFALVVTVFVCFYGWNSQKNSHNGYYHPTSIEQPTHYEPNYSIGEL